MAQEKKNEWAFKRFFSPLNSNIRTFVKSAIVMCFYSFFTILTVEIFKNATSLIQNNDAEWVKKLIITYVVIIIIFVIFNRLCRNVWAEMRHNWRRLIQKKVFPVFFKLDNTSIEKLGTWKIQQVMDAWMSNWRELFIKLAQKIPDLVILSIFVLYQIFQIWGWKYIGIFFLLFWIIFSIVTALNKKWLFWRQKKEIIKGEHWRQFVKMIMSKMEIVQNNQEISEIQKDDKILQDIKDCDLKINTVWWFIMDGRLSNMDEIYRYS